jgi:hypothetical protein
MNTDFLFEVIDIILPDTKIIPDLKGKILESSNHDADRALRVYRFARNAECRRSWLTGNWGDHWSAKRGRMARANRRIFPESIC